MPTLNLDAGNLVRIGATYALAGTLELPSGNQQSNPPASFSAALETLFRYGFSMPLNSFIEEVLDYFGLAPFQLMVNSYIIIVGMYMAYASGGIGKLTIPELMYMYNIKQSQGSIYYLIHIVREGLNGLVNLPKKISKWDSDYFFYPSAQNGVFCDYLSKYHCMSTLNFYLSVFD